MAFTPDGKYAYVTNNTDGTVSVITTATHAVSAPITVGTQPVGVTITPDGEYAYVANNIDDTVSSHHDRNRCSLHLPYPSAHARAASRSVPSQSPTNPDKQSDRCGVGLLSRQRSGQVAITRDGKHAYVTNFGDDTVSVITTATGAVSAPITVGKARGGGGDLPGADRDHGGSTTSVSAPQADDRALGVQAARVVEAAPGTHDARSGDVRERRAASDLCGRWHGSAPRARALDSAV